MAALIPSLLMAVTQPVWSRVDEAQHTDFIIQLSHGVYPLADRTVIAPETLRIMQLTGVFRFEDPGTYPSPDLSDIGPPPDGMSARDNAVWMSRHLWQLSYESAQTPGYYVLMVPIWSAADRLLGTLGAVYVMRIINALLIALLAPMAIVVAGRIAPGETDVAAAAAAFAILLPGLALNGTRVSNDALAAALAGICIVVTVMWVGQPWTWRRMSVLGLAFGAGLLVKITLIALGPALVIAVIWPGAGPGWRERVWRATVPLAIAAACLLPWFIVNLHLYGVPVPSARTSRLIDTPPMAFSPAFILVDAAFFIVTFWSGEPLGALPLAAAAAALGFLLALIAAAGLTRFLMRPHKLSGGRIAVALAAVSGMVALALLLPATNAFKFAAPGRYAYSAMPAAAALMGLGIFAAIRGGGARRILLTAYAMTAAVVLAGGAFSVSSSALKPGHGEPPAGARTGQIVASGGLNGVTIRVDREAVDPSARAIWVHVVAMNSGSTEAEWSPVPLASEGDAVGYGDYTRSTQLPGDIDPGMSLTGWLFVGLDPALLHLGGTVHLRFPDVATDGYASVRDIDVDVDIDPLLAS